MICSYHSVVVLNKKTRRKIMLENNRRDFLEMEIRSFQQLLTNTDYKAIKYAEGAITEEEFAETKAKRQHWRDMINEYQEELAEIESGSGEA